MFDLYREKEGNSQTIHRHGKIFYFQSDLLAGQDINKIGL